jgi:hypothetical protein
VITGRTLADDLLVSPVGLSPPLRDPGDEGGVHLLDGGEDRPDRTWSRTIRTCPFDTALARGPVGGQNVDIEVVVAGEPDRFRVQRNRLT